MTSFVDVMGDTCWTDAQINAKMRELRRTSYQDEEWEFLVQKMLGALVGMVPDFAALAYQLSDAEKAEIAQFAQVLYGVQAAGRAARADMALLAQALAVEAGTLDPATVLQAVTDLLAARAAARPAPEPTPEPTSEPHP